MKRRLIRQAGQAFTVTLPIDWIRSNKLDEKSEVDINISGKTLLVSTDNQTYGGKIKLDLEDIESNRSIYLILNALYAKGVDEVEVVSSKNISPVLTEAADKLIGFALVSKKDKSFVIKDISPGSYGNLDEVFKRVFQIILLFYDDAVKDILGERKQTIEGLEKRDLEVNKFCLFLQRAINKRFYQDSAEGRALFTYSFALEELSDEVMRMWRTNVQYKVKKSKEIVEALDFCKKQLEEAFDAYYQFNLKRLSKSYAIREEIRARLLKQKNIDGKTAMFFKHIVKIAEEAADLSHLNLLINLKEEKV